MEPEIFLVVIYMAAAVLFLRARRKAVWGLGGASATIFFLFLAFAMRLDIKTINVCVLGLLLCLFLPKRRGRV